MGAYNSNFIIDQKEIIKIKPNNSQWLFIHAESSGMSFSEVQRCWRRFRQMGVNKKGVLTKNSSVWSTEDKFMEQILRLLPWSRKQTLSFQVYLKLCQWFSKIDEEMKLKVIYAIFNSGQLLTAEVIQRVLNHVYPDMTFDALKELAEDFISEVDYKKQGAIDEEEFISFAKEFPFDEMAKLLHFHIIPASLQQLE